MNKSTTLTMIQAARDLSKGSDNEEYIRGQAELIAQFVETNGDPSDYHEAIDLITELIRK